MSSILGRAPVLEDTQRVLCGKGRLSLIESAPLRWLLIGEALELRKCWIAMLEGILKEEEEVESKR